MYSYSLREAEIRGKLVLDSIHNPRVAHFYGGNLHFFISYLLGFLCCLDGKILLLIFLCCVVEPVEVAAVGVEIVLESEDEELGAKVKLEDEECGFPSTYKDDDDENDDDNIFIPQNGNFPEDEDGAGGEDCDEGDTSNGEQQKIGTFFSIDFCFSLCFSICVI